MEHSYKLNYTFQSEDKRDHIFKTTISPCNTLEISTIVQPSVNLKKTFQNFLNKY